MAHWLFLPNDAIKDLETLASLPQEKVLAFKEFLDSRDFRQKYSVYVKAADLLSIADEAAASLCGFTNYVQRQRENDEKPGSAVVDELEHFLKKTEDREGKSKRERLLSYVRGNKETLSS